MGIQSPRAVSARLKRLGAAGAIGLCLAASTQAFPPAAAAAAEAARVASTASIGANAGSNTSEKIARQVRAVASAAMMPVVDRVSSDGDWAIAVGVFEWDRNSNRSGPDPRTALLVHKLPFGWQAVTATDGFSQCEFKGWSRAYGISGATAVRLAAASQLKYKKAAAECAVTSSDHAREFGPATDVIAVRKILRDGLMVPYVAVSGNYAMAVANGDDVANILFQRMSGRWERVADFEEDLHVEKLTTEFGVPKHTACTIVPGATAASLCR